jgi:glycosyltransferase involved in cell wall biosynthesis
MVSIHSDASTWEGRLSVIIPAFNEENGLGPTLAGLRAALPAAEVIVVDDGSTDRTVEAAMAVEGVRVLRHPFNRGYGAALKSGMRAATGAYVAWFDADNEHRVEDLARIVARLDAEGLVAVIGERGTGSSRFRSTGKAIIAGFAWLLGLKQGADLNCGLRAFRREAVLPYLPLLPNRYSASMTSTMIVSQRGYPFAFEPITTRPRIGSSKVVIGDGFQALVLVLRMIMLFAPLRIFLPSGLTLMAAGLAYGAIVALTAGLGVPTLAVVMVITGLVLALQGLIADQISYMRLSQLESAVEAEPIEQGEVRGTST